MSEFLIEAVGEGEDKSVTMPKGYIVFEILQRLSVICSGEESRGFDWKPKGEFRYRERKWDDQVFRVEDFEGRGETKQERPENDGGPGRAGLDVLGKYTLNDSNPVSTYRWQRAKRVLPIWCPA